MKPAIVAAFWLMLGTVSWAGAQESRPKLSIFSDDGESSIEFHLAVQFRWEYGYIEGAAGEDHSTLNRLVFRRIRPVIKGSLITGDLTYLLHLNLVPGSLELMDLWFDYRFHDQVRARVGQAKVPFTRYRINSFQDRPVVEWSWPTRYFGAERQWGVMLHNGVGKPPPIEYQVGIYTGVNARASNGIGMTFVYGDSLDSPSDLSDPDPGLVTDMHSELVFHVAYNHGGINVKNPTDFEGGAARFSAGMSAAWDLDPTPFEDMRLRLAPEVELKVHGFAATAIAYFGFTDLVFQASRYHLGLVGGLFQCSYLFLERFEIALRYTNISILEDLRTDARSRAEAKILSAGSTPDAEAVYNRYRYTGHLMSEHEVNLGFNWYWFGTTFKWQVDVGLLVHELEEEILYDVQLRTQIQLAF
jgi:hypothetical protein